MSALTKTAILITVSLALIVSVTAIADRDRPAAEKPRQPARNRDGVQQLVRLHRQAVEVADDPLLSSAIAISRIKEIAISRGKLAEGAGALQYVAGETRNPVVRRLALLALSELRIEANEPAEAIRTLGEICLGAPGPEPEQPCPGMCPRGRMGAGPCPREREEMDQRRRMEQEELERHERREMELRDRERMEPMRLERPGPEARMRMGESIREDLQRRSRELDEKARLIEQRMVELKRWAQDLERRERDR